MYKFNETNIVTGYIKQLLKDFNLPKFKIYTKEQQKFFAKNNIELNVVNTIKSSTYPRNIWYIKNDNIQQYIDGVWKKVANFDCYTAGKKYINYTTNLNINSIYYDSDTHEYLGNYLRFMRDYENIDLMSMYNCFSNRLCDNLELSFDLYTTQAATSKVIEFNSYNTNYKIYSIPVKLFKQYTIAIESDLPIELCCGIYKNNLNEENEYWTQLPSQTYKKITNSKFSKQFTYDMLVADSADLSDESGLSIHDNILVNSMNGENYLRLFLKIPASNTSSIVILEGNYVGYSDTMLLQSESTSITGSSKNLLSDTRLSNKYISNFKIADRIDYSYDEETTESEWKPAVKVGSDEDFNVFTPISRLQLLDMNTGISYPFANRLVGYLTGNTITDKDTIDDNIVRAQTVVESAKVDVSIFGAWENKMRVVFYDYMRNTPKITDFNTDMDILGYIDKDVEKNYLSNRKNGLTLNNVNIYPGLYKDLYKEDK